MRDYNMLRRKAAKVAGEQPPCPACANRPTLVRLPEGAPDPEPCPECGSVPDVVFEAVVATRTDAALALAAALARAQGGGPEVIGPAEYNPGPRR